MSVCVISALKAKSLAPFETLRLDICNLSRSKMVKQRCAKISYTIHAFKKNCLID